MGDFFEYYARVFAALLGVFSSAAGALLFWVPMVGWLVIRSVRRLRPRWSDWLERHRAIRRYDVLLPILALGYAVPVAHYTVYEQQVREIEAATRRAESERTRVAQADSVHPPMATIVKSADSTLFGYDANLLVRNSGAKAGFRARLRIETAAGGFEPVVRARTYEAVWERSGSDETELFTGQDDRIILGGDAQGRTPVFHFYNVSTRSPDSVLARTASAILDIEVKLVSEPPMATGPLVRRYRITESGLFELPPMP